MKNEINDETSPMQVREKFYSNFNLMIQWNLSNADMG